MSTEGNPEETKTEATPDFSENVKKIDDDDNDDDDDDDDSGDELENDEELEYYYEDENKNEIIVETSSNTSDDSLEKLLEDARQMRQMESGKEIEEDTPIKKSVKGIISTVVTADFFVVCALLAWFLAGIFCNKNTC